jgi:hypothetical protein
VVTQSYAQKHKVLQKVFDTNQSTTAVLNLNHTNVTIQRSTDGKMYIDYVVEFENYPKKEVEEILEDVEIEATKFDNNIHLEINGFGQVISYKIEKGFILNEDFLEAGKTTDSILYVRKSKDSIIKQIQTPSLEGFKKISKFFKIVTEQGETSHLKKKNVKVRNSSLIIKIPKDVRLNILAEKSEITIDHNFVNELNLTCVGGTFKAKHLQNPNNNVEINDADLKIETISNGLYHFKKVKNGMIAEVKNTVIDSEFSKIEFGEIGENVKINDFNSTYWLYNFTEDFERFNVLAEYSKLYLFCPETDYELSTFGHNTIHYIDGLKITMQLNREGKKSKMMEHRAKTDTPAGHIDLDIVNGVLYTTDEFIIEN